jgi:magnesium-transporting ATPase (P-type)
MDRELKRYHTILPVLFIPVCLLILLSYGWMGYATLKGREGLTGNYYMYYNLKSYQFYIYNFLIALFAMLLILAQINYLVKKNPQYLNRTFWAFTIFIVLLLVCEIYLQTKFEGKP